MQIGMLAIVVASIGVKHRFSNSTFHTASEWFMSCETRCGGLGYAILIGLHNEPDGSQFVVQIDISSPVPILLIKPSLRTSRSSIIER